MTSLEVCHCVSDPWFSAVLNRAVYRLVECTALEGSGNAPATMVPWERCSQESPVFIYATIPSSDVKASARLGQRGFYCAESRLVFEKQRQPERFPVPDTFTIRYAIPADEQEVRRIARCSFSYSRFHCDPRFSRVEADAVKEAWAANFFTGGRGTHMIVAVSHDTCIGFLQLCAQHDVLTIDLIAVAPEHRHHGIADAMIAYAERTCSGHARIRVGTQAANIPSVRLYERLGFRLVASYYVLHYHN
ncbi:MAG: GNAT family N-acetyltransferase [Desulfobacterota bacterium]|nr:GNAT family N-acetyltransferase [Thermodesulfobacteriota bacterium]